MMRHYAILQIAAILLAPPILLFALYVQFHGDYSPGGGFQAGVIFATAMMLYALIFGVIATRSIFSIAMLRIGMALGTLLYGGVGLAGMMLGGAFLDYAPLAQTPQGGRHLGIFLVEIGVGLTVAATMIAVFRSFTTKKNRPTPPAQESSQESSYE